MTAPNSGDPTAAPMVRTCWSQGSKYGESGSLCATVGAMALRRA